MLAIAAVALAVQGASGREQAGDFDGDGRDELLLRHEHTGAWRYYAVADTGAEGHELPLPTADVYRFMGIGDFDGDGRDDVLLRRRDNRAWLYYAVQAPDASPRAVLREGFGVTENPAFELRGVGDLDGDGRDDLVLRNTGTGEWIAYLMDGTRSQLRRGLGATRNLRYVFAGLGDFNGDGRDDLLLRHAEVGAWIAYEMAGDIRGVLRRTALTRNPAFAFKGIGDLNGDGQDDVVLRNEGTGEWIHYEMSGSRAILHRHRDVPRDAAFGYAATGDFDGDGDGTLLVRHRHAGDWIEYDLSGSMALAGRYAGLVEDLGWRPVNLEAANSDDGLWVTEDGRIVLELVPDDTTTANPFDLNGRTVVFTPDGEGGYVREIRALAWEDEVGESLQDRAEVTLPFAFVFGGRSWSSFTIRRGLLVFGGTLVDPYWDLSRRFDTMQQYERHLAAAATPSIAPLYKPVLGSAWHTHPVDVATGTDRVVVTWSATEPTHFVHGVSPETTPRVQGVLYADGRIAFHYRDVGLGDGVVGLFPGFFRQDLIVSMPDAVNHELAGHLDLTEVAIYESSIRGSVIVEFTVREPIPEPGPGESYDYRLYFDTDEPYWTSHNHEDQDFHWIVGVHPGRESTFRGATVLPRDDRNRIALLVDMAEAAWITASVIAAAVHFDANGVGRQTTGAPVLVEMPVPPPPPNISGQGRGPTETHREVFHHRSIRHLGDLACRVIGLLGDQFDLFVFHTEFRVDAQESTSPWRNYGGNLPVAGIGDLGMSRPPCEARTLKGHWALPVWIQSNHVADDALLEGGRFDRGLNLLAHEFIHIWLAHMSYDRDSRHERLNGDVCLCHWRFELHAPAAFPWRADAPGPAHSIMGGRTWRDNGDGTFTPSGAFADFVGGGPSWLDLYAMGLADASEVPDMFILHNLQPVDVNDADGPYTGDKEVVTINQIIAAEGPRLPSASNAQTVFNVGFVYLVAPGRTPDPDLLALHQAFRDEVPEHWAHITGGRSEMTATVPEPAARCISGRCAGAAGRLRSEDSKGASGVVLPESETVP